MLEGRILVAQGGGPTAVINQSLVGIVLEARKHAGVSGVYGAQHGVRGIVDENFLDLGQESADNLERVAETPCSALGSTRDKPDLRILSDEAKSTGYPLTCIHIPKTIDNDLTVNDHTPGYPSAAKFVSNAFAGVTLDNRALQGVYVGVIMGRHAGFLTAASALGRKYEDDGPHLIYLPERSFSLDGFLSDIKRVYDRLGRCVIAVSEGIHEADGTLIAAKLAKQLETDAHGNVQLSGTGALADLLTDSIKTNTTISRVRGDTFGYLQRSFMGCVSDVDQAEARAAGEHGVRFANELAHDGSVTLHRTGEGADYGIEFRLSPLQDVAGKTQVMADRFIADCATDVTPAFIDYLKPLVGSEMVYAHRLHAPKVKKVLHSD